MRVLFPLASVLLASTAGFARSAAAASQAGSSATLDPWSWIEEAKLEASDAGPDDRFGEALALSGDTLLVGAPLALHGGSVAGAVYVFERSGSTWTETAKLTSPDGAPATRFGAALALEGDYALIGAPTALDLGLPAGAAFVFVRTGTTWSPRARLSANDPFFCRHLGESVALDANSAVLGASDSGLQNQGAVYVFTRAGVSWSLQARLDSPIWSQDTAFGVSVALSGDTVLIGAPYDDDAGLDSGAAYVFERLGASWGQVRKLLSPLGGGSRFGRTVALDGDTGLVGSSTGNRAFVHVRAGGLWSQQAELQANDLPVQNAFGNALALEGERAVIGAYLDDEGCGGGFECNAGAAYVFERSGSSWGAGVKLVASDAGQLDRFGTAVAVSGGTIASGAPWDLGLGTQPGAAYVFANAAPAGQGFCFGDPGSGTACPCANDNDGSVPGSGCANGVFSSGAYLVGSGGALVGHDTLVLHASGLEPGNSGLYFQGDLAASGGNGAPFGDGLRCVAGSLVRLQVRGADASGTSSTTVALAAKGGVSAGETRLYQCWYRTTQNPPCGSGVNNFNLSNGYEVTWLP